MIEGEDAVKQSTFFDSGPLSTTDSLAILHLKRDHLTPVVLQSTISEADGYAEGAVTNTRFGSFPHTTLLGLPWGSQVLASKVDTGSRGRKGPKRKKDDDVEDVDTPKSDEVDGPVKAAVAAGTGFIHLLPPTPESWTSSLPHRTQVVYTPDYSYVLQRLRVCPGQTVIEAGAGSGSFTHAAARAVFRGHARRAESLDPSSKKRKLGRVCSFEYHEPRATGLRKELKEHGLEDVVTVTHRDVYEHGFCLDDAERPSPKANAVFLDLPAPWLALRHLARRPIEAVSDGNSAISPLDPESPVHLCTFSPCIEQVQSTVAALRELGWTEIEMVEVQHRRIDVRRERTGLHEEGLRGVNASAASVDEAVQRLREVEGRFRDWHEQSKARKGKKQPTNNPSQQVEDNGSQIGVPSRQARLDRIKREFENRKTYKDGQLVHRTEPDIKSHTSYLVFAVLLREWSAEDEERCLSQYGTGATVKEDGADQIPADVVGKKAKKPKTKTQLSS